MNKEKRIVKFLFEQHQRLGCLIRFSNIPRLAAQSVAEHSYCVTFSAMLVADYLNNNGYIKVDKLKLLEMGLIHDVEEVISGDILKTLKHGKFKVELDKLNEQNMTYLTRLLKEGGDRYFSLWQEAKDKKTIEAKVLSFIDMIDRLMYCLKETHMGNHYFRELLEFEAVKLLDWRDEIPELYDLVIELSSYVSAYLAGDKKVLNEISRAVRIYDYKIGE